jgi:hypothetical protein
VDVNASNPSPPYTNWATAATVIQDAVDAAGARDEIIVTDGIYAAGGRPVGTNLLSNRVAVTKPLTFQSVNGPQTTIIQGQQVATTTNGDGAVRCVYLTNGAAMTGFTLRGGATRTSGDLIQEQSGGGLWCESSDSIVSNCALVGNAAAFSGGGALSGTLNNCTLSANWAYQGGGAWSGTLSNCLLSGNSATYGGGAESGTLNACTVSGNQATIQGGGADSADLNSCAVNRNSCAFSGGGASDCKLRNCTVTGNFAPSGGGVAGGQGSRAFNCVIYYNTAIDVFESPNYDGDIFLSTCWTTPIPYLGAGNFDGDPQLASLSHLSANSHCIGRGNYSFTTGVDIDGEPWADPPSIGCDEYRAGSATGAVTVAVVAAYTNVATGFSSAFTASIQGRVSGSRWDFGDGASVTDRPYVSHAWTAGGDYPVILTAWNESYPGGVAATAMVHVVSQPTYYVAQSASSPSPPYASWDMAATNIQDAIDAAVEPGATVLVSNGVYAAGGRLVHGGLSNRVAVAKPVIVRSVNGPAFTMIAGWHVAGSNHGNGDAAVRCVYLTNGAVLAGFTITNGATRASGDEDTEESGGGVWCESSRAVISNCWMSGNSAFRFAGGSYSGSIEHCVLNNNSATYGGAAHQSIVTASVLTGNVGYYNAGGLSEGIANNCLVTSNTAGNSTTGFGGGTFSSTVNNCTIVGNTAQLGGGDFASHLTNCILYYNGPAEDSNFDYQSSLSFCCTVPLPSSGMANFTNPPLFVDLAAGDFHLQTNAPCINAGNNAVVATPFDLDGNPRIVGGTVDVGAYELPNPASIISYAWLEQYGLPIDGSADFADPDRDGMNNWQEWICGTNPTNALSVLRMLSATPGSTNVTVSWQSVAGINYFLEGSADLATPFALLATNIIGQVGTTSYADTNATGLGPFFYRVGVAHP